MRDNTKWYVRIDSYYWGVCIEGGKVLSVIYYLIQHNLGNIILCHM